MEITPVPVPESMGRMDEVVGARLRALRAERRLRQADVAEATHMARSSYEALESGQRPVTLLDLVLVCQVFQVDLAELLAGTDASRWLGLDQLTLARNVLIHGRSGTLETPTGPAGWPGAEHR